MSMDGDQPARAPGLPSHGETTFRSRFLGLTELPDRLLLTPVGFLAQRLATAGTMGPSLWPARSAEGVPVIHGPQGRPIVDCVFSMLVSDEPPGQPFWETDLAALAPAADMLLGALRPWLRGNGN